MFSIESLTSFHCGLFFMFYVIVALAIHVYHKDIKSTISLLLVSLSSALAHFCAYLINEISPDNMQLHLGLMSYCTWASPTIMLCIKEALSNGWLTWNRYLRYISPFLVGTIICITTSSTTVLYILIGLSIFSTIYCTIILNKGIDMREKLVKEFFTDIESFGHGWVKSFMYFQILTSVCTIVLFSWHNLAFNIFWNYIQAAFWLFFLLKCKEQHYYSTQIPDDVKPAFDDLDKEMESAGRHIFSGNTEAKAETTTVGNENQEESSSDKNVMSQDTLDYLEKRLADLEADKCYLDDSLNLNSLAQAIGTNRTYMSMYFRLKKTTFWDYINNKRCQYAIELMKERPNITMAELFPLCGYKTENCFRTSFSSIYGKTPFAYKRAMRLGN